MIQRIDLRTGEILDDAPRHSPAELARVRARQERATRQTTYKSSRRRQPHSNDLTLAPAVYAAIVTALLILK